MATLIGNCLPALSSILLASGTAFASMTAVGYNIDTNKKVSEQFISENQAEQVLMIIAIASTAMMALSLLGANGVGCSTAAAILLTKPLINLASRFELISENSADELNDYLATACVLSNIMCGLYSCMLQPSYSCFLGVAFYIAPIAYNIYEK